MGRKRNILMVDGVQELKEDIKRRFDDAEITEVSDGQAARDFLDKPNQIDLVVIPQEKQADKPIKEAIKKSVVRKVVEKSGGVGDPTLGGKKEKIRVIRRFVEKNYKKKIYLDDIASLFGLSSKYVSRFFKETTGMTFSDYRLKFKVEKSKDLLEKTEYNINQIAHEVGYENSESFIRIFEKHTGKTPSEYRIGRN